MPVRPPRLVAVLTALVLALSACGGDDGARDRFIAALSDDGQVTAEQAGCVYDRLADELDEGQIESLDLQVEPDDPAVAAAAIAAFDACLDG